MAKDAKDAKDTRVKFKNYMEVLVEETLEGWIKKGEKFCYCKRCHLDIMAFALNHLPAKYIVTQQGKLFTEMAALQLQSGMEVKGRVLDAIRLVQKNPRH